MQLLIIGYVWPEPESSAAGSRMMQLLHSFLQQGWHITFACQSTESENSADLESLGIEKAHIEVNNSEFDLFVTKNQPDIVIFDRFMMEEQFGWRVQENCPHALRILESSDLHCLRHARHQALKQTREITLQDYHSDMAKREIASILRCDISLMISEWEMQLLQDVFKIDESLLHYIPLMYETIDIDNQKTVLPTFEKRQGCIFIGNFHHAPNWDAVQYLKQTVWPSIRELLPQVTLSIYGAYTPEKAKQLHNPKEGFNIEGWVPDVKTVMSQARVNLAPLRFGAGMKGKLTDAMIYGTPSVSTSIGAEGMHGNLPWGGHITDDVSAFAKATADLYQHQQAWEAAQIQGFNIINARHDQVKLKNGLFQKLLSVQENLQAHRLKNFTGAMLSHHSMKSTEYMSRWIEAKNKKH